MAFAKFEKPIQDSSGNLVTNVSVRVRRETAGAPDAVLYSDAAGASPLSNPATFADGICKFYTLGSLGGLRLDASATGYSQTFRNEQCGTGGEIDANTLLGAAFNMEFETSTSAPPSSGCVRADNATLSSATVLYIHETNDAGSDWAARLAALLPGDVILLTAGDGTQVSWVVTSNTDSGAYRTVGVTGHAGATTLSAGSLNVELLYRGQGAGLTYAFSNTTTDADPGAGTFRLNAAAGSATAAYIDNTEALAGATVTSELDSWDDSTSTVKGYLRIVKKSDPSIWRLYSVSGSIVDGTGYRKVTLTHITGSGSFSAGEAFLLQFARTGDAGSNGSNGTNGTNGVTAGLRYNFDTTTTDADPGSGDLRLNDASPASATAAYLDNVDADGATVTGALDTWDDSTSTVKGQLLIRSASTPATFALYSVTGSVVDGTGYRKLTLTYLAGNGSFSNAEAIAVQFYRTGDQGTISGASGELESTDAGAAEAPILSLYRNSPSPAAADAGGELDWNFQDSGGNKTLGALIRAILDDPTNGSEDVSLSHRALVAGSMVEHLLMGGDVVSLLRGRLKFPSSQNASSDVNTLDDYEEGTFTPGITFGGGTTGMTFSAQQGQYTKFGRLVMATARLVFTNKGTSTGAAKLTGLPFTSSISTLVNGGNIIYYTGMSSMASAGGWMVTTATEMQLVIFGATSGTDLTHANFNNTTDIVVTAFYNAAT